MNNSEIKKIYELYGFILEKETDDIIVFTYTNGYFNNAEIICLKEVNINNYRKEYEEIGYSVSVIKKNDIESIHEKLFSGFFYIKSAKKKNKNEYNLYCKKQEEKLFGNKYQYLNCEYIVNNEIIESGVVDLIFEKLNSTGPQMIILEAAAGYGKTCTAYEILNKYADSKIQKVPLITELSRNRKANVFRYVLLSEIDRQFSSLSSTVVEHEIRQGNVPLIIDGFDELLSKSIYSEHDNNDSFEEVQGMLDTISLLLSKDSNTKILITSRKSAIFTGDQFDEWIENRDLASYITRIELRPPKVKDWIGLEKTQILQEKDIEIEYISNPILLSLLRCSDTEYISKNSVNSIIDDYFSTLLEREQERQSLYLSKEEQLDIMYRLAANFASFNISSEESDFIKFLISEIISENIETYISRYKNRFITDAEIIPDEDEFIMKLVHHALLDRTISGKNQIGFINDFFFGIFLGYALVKNYISDLNNLDFKFIDLIATAFTLNDMEIRDEVISSIKLLINNYTSTQQLEISNKLFHENIVSYNDEYFSNILFSNGFRFSDKLNFCNCIFSNCIFNNCYISNKSFLECQFYNCSFYEINYSIVEPIVAPSSLMFLGCTGHEEIAKAFSNSNDNYKAESDINFEKILLEQFWKVGSLAPEQHRAFTAVYKGVGNKNIPHIDEAIKTLLKRGIIRKRNFCYELDFTKMKEIKEILDRD